MNNVRLPVAIKVIKYNPEVMLPQHFNSFAVGADIYSPADVLIKAKHFETIDTGLILDLSPHPDVELQIRSRSGLAAKHGIIVLNSPGTIDSDYKQTIKILLANLSSVDYQVQKGDRIAQFVLSRYERISFITGDCIDKNDSTSPNPVRTGGLGSTGR